MPRYAPAREVMLRLGRAAARSIPTGFSNTLPAPLRADPSAPLRCVFYVVTGLRDVVRVSDPEWVADLAPSTGEVLRLAPCTAAEVGCAPPRAPVPGAGVTRGTGRDDFWTRGERVYDLLPGAWERFATGAARTAADVELQSLWPTLVVAEAAPLQVLPTPAFFRWLRG